MFFKNCSCIFLIQKYYKYIIYLPAEEISWNPRVRNYFPMKWIGINICSRYFERFLKYVTLKQLIKKKKVEKRKKATQGYSYIFKSFCFFNVLWVNLHGFKWFILIVTFTSTQWIDFIVSLFSTFFYSSQPPIIYSGPSLLPPHHSLGTTKLHGISLVS